METQVKAFAKLNISLDVLSKREDGYHEMRMVMQSVDLCDDITLRLKKGEPVRARTNLRYLPCDRRNIAVKAAELFFKEAGLSGYGAEIHITKRIPVCAGLGGGSSDGAAVLRALNTATGAGLTREKLESLGERLGSDVPFCVAGGTSLATGRGEILRDLSPLPDCFALICKPDFAISTPELFGKIDTRTSRCHPDTDGILAALDSGDLYAVARRMHNVFEDVLPRQYRAIGEIKGAILDRGAIGVTMSGTGSAVFGLFDDEKRAREAHEVLTREYRDCFLARTMPRLDI